MIKYIVFLLVVKCIHTAYDQKLALNLFRLAVASYCQKSQVQSWSCRPCRDSPLSLTHIKTFQNSTKDTLGFIGVSQELHAVVLVFRGTLPWDIKNWISNINFVAIQYPLCNSNCKVHRGFYFAYLDIAKQVLDTVIQYRQLYPQPQLVVLGHSLGGALATHAVAHLMAAKIPTEYLYTYGCPRVGDKKFTLWFNEGYGAGHFKGRVTHQKDPVPHLPLQEWGFLHLNTEVFYKDSVKTGYVLCKDDNAEDKNCSDKYAVDANVLDHLTYYDIDMTSIVLACQ